MPARIVNPDDIRRLHAEGMTDRQIAAALGVCVNSVRVNRRAVGLTSNRPATLTDEHKKKLRASVLARYGGDGSAATASARKSLAERRTRLAGMYGLPPEVSPVQVVILLALTAGPLSANDLADRSGRRKPGRNGYHRFFYAFVDGHNYLTALRRLGLIGVVRRGAAGTHGGSSRLYFLTPHCLDLLASATTDDTRRTDSGRETSGEADGSQTQDPAGC